MSTLKTSLLVLAFVVLAAFRTLATPLPTSSIEYTYDKYGNCKAVTTKNTAGQVLEQSTYTYDNYRRPVEMAEAAQIGSTARRWTWYYDRWFGSQNYDPYAHTSKQWRVQVEPAYDGVGTRNLTARWFDANDRIVDEYTGVLEFGDGHWENGPD